MREQSLEARAALLLRGPTQILSVDGNRVERHERGRRLQGKLRDAGRGRMEPHLERVEIQAVGRRDDDLAVQHAALGQACQQRVVQLGKVAVEGTQVAALDEDLSPAAEDDRAEAVPFRLIQPPIASRELVRKLGQHRLDGWTQWKRRRQLWGPPVPPPRW